MKTFVDVVAAHRAKLEAAYEERCQTNPYYRRRKPDGYPKLVRVTDDFSFVAMRGPRGGGDVVREGLSLRLGIAPGYFPGPRGASGFFGAILYRDELLLNARNEPHLVAGGAADLKATCERYQAEGLTPEGYVAREKRAILDAAERERERDVADRMRAFVYVAALRRLLDAPGPLTCPDGEVPRETIERELKACEDDLRHKVVDNPYRLDAAPLPAEWKGKR